MIVASLPTFLLWRLHRGHEHHTLYQYDSSFSLFSITLCFEEGGEGRSYKKKNAGVSPTPQRRIAHIITGSLVHACSGTNHSRRTIHAEGWKKR